MNERINRNRRSEGEPLVRQIEMKITDLVLLTGLSIFLLSIEEAGAAPKPECDETVVGQGTSPDDVDALDDAINGGHDSTVVTICLEGTFDFSTTDRLLIDPVPNNPGLEELNIVGIGPQKPTLLGGSQPLTHPPMSTLSRIRIQNLRFVQPLVSAISILNGNGLVEISHIEIDGVQSLFLPAFGASFREAILVNSILVDDISGEVIIRDNVLDGGDYDPEEDLSAVNTGIAVFGPFGVFASDFSAKVTVTRNTLKHWSGSAIAGISLSGAEISHNTIEPGSFANQIVGCASATGVGATAGISLAGVTDSVVKSNTITLESALTGAGEIPDCTAGFILLGDTVSPSGDPVVAAAASGNEFKGNKVLGTGDYAIVVGTDLSAAEEENLFHDNNIHQFAPFEASLFLGEGANDNTFKGNFPTVSGNVAGNSITGIK